MRTKKPEHSPAFLHLLFSESRTDLIAFSVSVQNEPGQHIQAENEKD